MKRLSPSASVRLLLGVATLLGGFALVPYRLRVVALAAILAWAAPYYARALERWESQLLSRHPIVAWGRGLRWLIHSLAVTGLLALVEPPRLFEAPFIATAGVGFQSLAIRAAYRGRAPMGLLVQVAFLSDAVLLASVGSSLAGWLWLRSAVCAAGLASAAVELVRALRSDWRARWPRSGGIGLFVGTFNPMHRTHVDMVRAAVQGRCLSRVYVHPTVVPKLHADALAQGAIQIVREAGMRVYQTTKLADPMLNYFPTGRCFYEHETRVLLARLSFEDGGLAETAEVISWPEQYRRGGFYAVIDELRRRHPLVRIHGIHGSDTGGIWNRAIFDACGLIPFPFRREDEISATKVRQGADGMTMPRVTAILKHLREGSAGFSLDGRNYEVVEGVVRECPGPSSIPSASTSSSASAGASRQPEPQAAPAKTTLLSSDR